MNQSANGVTSEVLESGLRLSRDVLDPMKITFVGKDEVIDLLGVCLVAGENLFILGPPGTAKSMLIRTFCELAGVDLRVQRANEIEHHAQRGQNRDGAEDPERGALTAGDRFGGGGGEEKVGGHCAASPAGAVPFRVRSPPMR